MERGSAAEPMPRFGHAMAPFQDGNRVIVFGGSFGNGRLADAAVLQLSADGLEVGESVEEKEARLREEAALRGEEEDGDAAKAKEEDVDPSTKLIVVDIDVPLMDGQSKMLAISYIGEWGGLPRDGGLPSGKGMGRFPHGEIYEGRWLSGKRHGKGKATYKNSGELESYSGSWNAGLWTTGTALYASKHGKVKCTVEAWPANDAVTTFQAKLFLLKDETLYEGTVQRVGTGHSECPVPMARVPRHCGRAKCTLASSIVVPARARVNASKSMVVSTKAHG